MSNCLYECLKEAGLEKFHGALQNNGFNTAFSLLYIPTADLLKVGISSTSERQRFLQLIQIISAFHRDGQSSSSNQNSPIRNNLSTNENCAQTNSVKRYTSSQAGRNSANISNSENIPTAVAKKFINSTEKSKINPRPSVRNYMPLSESNYPESSNSNRISLPLDNKIMKAPSPDDTNYNDLQPEKGVLEIQKILHGSSYNYGLPNSKHRRINSNQENMRFPITPNKSQAISNEKITVCVRKRPLLPFEASNNLFDVITTNEQGGGKRGQIVVHELKQKVDLKEFVKQNAFSFDHVFDESSTNEVLYLDACKPLVSFVMTRSYRATCFCYGQTGAGKSHTLLGSESEPGVFMYSAQDILCQIQNVSSTNVLTLWISLYEIYCGKIFDLLNNQKRLVALEDSNKQVHINGLRQIQVSDIATLMQILHEGLNSRSVGVTATNADSSRSHAILQFVLKDTREKEFSRFSFIDLAGSERACDALQNSDKQNRLEGAEINQSLLALKECIRSLDQSQAHTPFRQSKLTQVLRDSFIGNSKTCMIANVSPAHNSLDHTMNTLRYASRVKELRKMRRPVTTATPKRKRNNIWQHRRPATAAVMRRSKSIIDKKPSPKLPRSFSLEQSLDVSNESIFQGQQLTRTPPSSPQTSVQDNTVTSSEPRPVSSEPRPVFKISNNPLFTPSNVQGSSTPVKSTSSKELVSSSTQIIPYNTQTDNDNTFELLTVKSSDETVKETLQMQPAISQVAASTDTAANVRSSVFDGDDSSKSSQKSSTDTSSVESADFVNSEPVYGLPQSKQNTGLPSPKKFLTYLKGRHSLKTQELKQQLIMEKRRLMLCDSSSKDSDSNHSEPANEETLRSTSILRPVHKSPPQDSTKNQTPAKLPSPKLDRSLPRRSSRLLNYESDSPPSTGGPSTPKRPPTPTNSSLKSASEFHIRLVDAFIDEGDSNMQVESKSETTTGMSNNANNNHKTKPHKLRKSRSVSDKEELHKAQSEVVIAHQEHISEILRVSIDEERLYHNLRDGWNGEVTFRSYTDQLQMLLTKKMESIQALRKQLSMYESMERSINKPSAIHR